MGSLHSTALLLALAVLNGFAVFAPIRKPGLQNGDFTWNKQELPATDERASPGSISTALQAGGDLSAITQRPLFNPARRPAVPAALKETVAVEDSSVQYDSLLPEGITLVGIAGKADHERMALVRTKTYKHARALTTGSQIEGWKITEMSANAIVLEQGETRCQLSVGKPTPSHGPCAPAGSDRADLETAQ